MSNLYELMYQVYQARNNELLPSFAGVTKFAGGTAATVKTPQGQEQKVEVKDVSLEEPAVAVSKRLIYSLLGLALGGLLSQSYFVQDRDDEFSRALKVLLGAGAGSLTGYYGDKLLGQIAKAFATEEEGQKPNAGGGANQKTVTG